MQHPNLEDRDPINVPVSAVPMHINAGWEVVEAPGEGGVPAEVEEKPVAEPRKRSSRPAAEEKKEDVS